MGQIELGGGPAVATDKQRADRILGSILHALGFSATDAFNQPTIQAGDRTRTVTRMNDTTVLYRRTSANTRRVLFLLEIDTSQGILPESQLRIEGYADAQDTRVLALALIDRATFTGCRECSV